MNTIPTAEEILNRDYISTKENAIKAMIDFAKLHVEACKKEITEKVRIIDDPRSYCGNTGSEYPPDRIIDKNSILNAYPLTKIL